MGRRRSVEMPTLLPEEQKIINRALRFSDFFDLPSNIPVISRKKSEEKAPPHTFYLSMLQAGYNQPPHHRP